MNNPLSRSNCLLSLTTVGVLALTGCVDPPPDYWPPVDGGTDTGDATTDTGGAGTTDTGGAGTTDTGGGTTTVSCTQVCDRLLALGDDCESIGDCPSLCEQVSDTVRQCTLDATTCDEAIQCTEGGDN